MDTHYFSSCKTIDWIINQNLRLHWKYVVKWMCIETENHPNCAAIALGASAYRNLVTVLDVAQVEISGGGICLQVSAVLASAPLSWNLQCELFQKLFRFQSSLTPIADRVQKFHHSIVFRFLAFRLQSWKGLEFVFICASEDGSLIFYKILITFRFE